MTSEILTNHKRVHCLKTVNPFFEKVWEGLKTAELRLNDRLFQKGHYVLLQEYDADNKIYGNREILILITDIITHEEIKGLTEDWVMLSFKRIANVQNFDSDEGIYSIMKN